MLVQNASEFGEQFLRLRRLAGKTQAELATAVGMDASRVSRIEDGKITLSDEEVQQLLEAIGRPEALRYFDYLAVQWSFLQRPAFDHPDLNALIDAEGTLQRITRFTSENASPALDAQARMHIDGLQRASAYLVDRRQSLAFLGPIGVGKTTNLCTLCGITSDNKGDPIDRVLLEYGGGRTTTCEVCITTGAAYQLVIEPYTDEEVIRFVNDFCAGLTDERSEQDAERGVAKEIDRALRNMTGLKKDRPKGRPSTDRAVELARTMTAEALRAHVFTLLRTWERTTTLLTHDPLVEPDGKAWLQRTFAAINKGQRPDVNLPRRITVTVPFPLLPVPNLIITVVDTKGIDRSALRPDLTNWLEHPRTITVLCSAFNEAPGPIFEQLLKQALETGTSTTVFPRIVGLALARAGEAKKMRDDADFVQSVEEGYELKIEHAEGEFRRWGCAGIPVMVYDANTDDPGAIHSFLAQKITSMRNDHTTRIHHISAEIDRLIHDHTSVLLQTAQREVFHRLGIFLQQHVTLPERASRVHERLDRALRGQHQRSIWATTTRSGTWPSMNVYYYLGIGTAIDARRRTATAIAGLRELINNMLGDNTLSPAHGFLRELQTNINTWHEAFIDAATRVAETTFSPALRSAGVLWTACEDLYGTGTGYRDAVANLVRNWFEEQAQAPLHALVEDHVQHSWQHHVIERLQAFCQSTDAADAA